MTWCAKPPWSFRSSLVPQRGPWDDSILKFGNSPPSPAIRTGAERGRAMSCPRQCSAIVFLVFVLNPAIAAWAQSSAPRGEKYALLVGVRRYETNELRELSYSESDV